MINFVTCMYVSLTFSLNFLEKRVVESSNSPVLPLSIVCENLIIQVWIYASFVVSRGSGPMQTYFRKNKISTKFFSNQFLNKAFCSELFISLLKLII